MTFGLSSLFKGAILCALCASSAQIAQASDIHERNSFFKLCESGTAAEIKRAIKNGAKINRTDSSGDTCLTWAAAFNGPEAVQAILDAGADITMVGKDGVTPMALAALVNRNKDTALTIATAEANEKRKSTKRKEQRKEGNGINDKDFIELCQHGTAEEIKAAIDSGANPNARVPAISALTSAAILNNDKESISTLIDNGADVNGLDMFGNTTLMIVSSIKKDKNIISNLIKNGADVNIVSASIETALTRSIKHNGNYDVVSELIKYGSNVNHKDKDGKTPLLIALENGVDDRIIQDLLNNGSDVNIEDKNGISPHIYVMRKLIGF